MPISYAVCLPFPHYNDMTYVSFQTLCWFVDSFCLQCHYL